MSTEKKARKPAKKFPQVLSLKASRVYVSKDRYWEIMALDPDDDNDLDEVEETEALRGDARIQAPCGQRVSLSKKDYTALRTALDSFFEIK